MIYICFFLSEHIMFPLTENEYPYQNQAFLKLYSKTAILLATLIGTPVAGGLLIYKNYKNLSDLRKAIASLFFCVLLTIVCVGGLLLIPEHILIKIPQVIIPLIYTTAVYFLIDGSMSQQLEEHEKNKRPFYSVWRSVGIAGICLGVVLGFYILYFSIAPDQFEHPAYVAAMTEFTQNENEALELFAMMPYAEPEIVSLFIREKGIPAWRKNIEILNRLNYAEKLHADVKHQINLYINYCNLRIRYYELADKAITEDTDKYDEELMNLSQQISVYLNNSLQ